MTCCCPGCWAPPGAARAQAPGLRLRVIPSGVPDADMLREERCHLLITPRLATLPSLLGAGLLRGLASGEPPMPCPPMPMYAVWHLRRQGDPMHQWLRALLDQVVPQALADARAKEKGAP